MRFCSCSGTASRAAKFGVAVLIMIVSRLSPGGVPCPSNQTSMGFGGQKSNLGAGLMPRDRAFSALIGVARGDLAGDMGTLFQIAADDDAGRRRAAAVALLKTAIAAVEACHHLIVAVAGGRFGLDQGLRLVAPFRPFIAAAQAAQEMQRAEDFGKPRQIAIVWSRQDLRR